MHSYTYSYSCCFKWGKNQSCLHWVYILTRMSAASQGTSSKKELGGIKLKSGGILVQNFGTQLQSWIVNLSCHLYPVHSAFCGCKADYRLTTSSLAPTQNCLLLTELSSLAHNPIGKRRLGIANDKKNRFLENEMHFMTCWNWLILIISRSTKRLACCIKDFGFSMQAMVADFGSCAQVAQDDITSILWYIFIYQLEHISAIHEI